MDQARVGVDVVAGLIPGTPMEEYTKRFFLTSREWDESGPDGQADLLIEMNGKAMLHAAYLMLQPDRLNWVKLEWVWF